MKSSFILLLLYSSLALCQIDQEIVEISTDCVNEIMENSISAERCMDESIGTPVDVVNRLKSIVFHYNHSDDDYVNLFEFANKNCVRFPEIIQCVQTTFKHSPECLRPNKERDDANKMILSGIESLSNYVCADNFDVIRKLIPNDGLRFLLVNDDFDKCFENVAERNVDHTGQICQLVDTAAPCILKVIGNHPNGNVLVVAQEIIARLRGVASCSNLLL